MQLWLCLYLGPRDIRMILAAVPFHTGTSIFSWVPSGPETVISLKEGDLDDNFYHHHYSGLSFVNTMRRVNRRGDHDDDDEREETFVFDVMASMEHIKMSATMKTATKLNHEIYLIKRIFKMNDN